MCKLFCKDGGGGGGRGGERGRLQGGNGKGIFYCFVLAIPVQVFPLLFLHLLHLHGTRDEQYLMICCDQPP